jgi:2-methylisocitrate lyase-like PEP mutase family enzyme
LAFKKEEIVMMPNKQPISPADKLRALLVKPEMIVMAACYDALSARLVERAGMAATFMSGFGVAAARLGMPDTGLISYGEMVDQGRGICNAVDIPVLGDGDTGFGNPLNIQRTVKGYHRAGFACIMIEDQHSPKRCGHTAGKTVVERDEALLRIRAAVDARNRGADILIMARTDARATHGLDEALARCNAFVEQGADITFLEAPRSEEEMQIYCREVPGPKMANLVEHGKTPILPPAQLERMGFKIAVYALTLLNVSIRAMQQALTRLVNHQTVPDLIDFKELQAIVGFDAYDEALGRFGDG